MPHFTKIHPGKHPNTMFPVLSNSSVWTIVEEPGNHGKMERSTSYSNPALAKKNTAARMTPAAVRFLCGLV